MEFLLEGNVVIFAYVYEREPLFKTYITVKGEGVEKLKKMLKENSGLTKDFPYIIFCLRKEENKRINFNFEVYLKFSKEMEIMEVGELITSK